MDTHILAMIDGKRYVCNAFGWQGVQDQKGDWQGVYYPAGISDVTKAINQQSTEFMDALWNAWEKKGLTPQQIAQIASEWHVSDADIKGWLAAVEGVTAPQDEPLRDEFEYEFAIAQFAAMLHHKATITHYWFINASEADLRAALEGYRVKAFELFQTMVKREQVTSETAKDTQWALANAEFQEKAWFVYMCLRRLDRI